MERFLKNSKIDRIDMTYKRRYFQVDLSVNWVINDVSNDVKPGDEKKREVCIDFKTKTRPILIAHDARYTTFFRAAPNGNIDILDAYTPQISIS